MCQAITCNQCGKVTWTGCGMHVEEVMANVPADQQCKGHEYEPPSGFFGRAFH